MPAEAGAVIAIWNGIADEARGEFYRWHETEHMVERVGIEGFLRGRRYRAVEGTPEFFTRYDLHSLDVLTSPAYMVRLNAPTEWTSRVLPYFRDTVRALCAVQDRFGDGTRAWLCSARVYGASESSETNFRLREFSAFFATAHEASVHLLVTDHAASGVETLEKRRRAGDGSIPSLVMLIECRDYSIAEQAAKTLAGLPLDSAGQLLQVGVYLLEYDLCR